MYLPARPACHEVPQAAILIEVKRLEVGLGDVLHLVEKHAAGVQRDAALHGVANGTRLLVNFLEHEMLEAALFRHDRIPGNSLDRGLDRIAFEVGYANGVSVDDGHLAVAEKKDVARVLQNWRNIRSDKKLADRPNQSRPAAPAARR